MIETDPAVCVSPHSSPLPGLRHQQLVVGLSVLWVVIWGLRGVLIETRVSGPDSMFPLCQDLHRLLTQGDLRGIWHWFRTTEVHPPLPYLVATLTALPLGFSLATVRLCGVLLHAVAVLQVNALARRMYAPEAARGGAGSSCRAIPTLAAAITATTPMAAGWFRLDYPDPLVAVLLLATLQLALRTDLGRARGAVALGVLIGLGALTHLRYPMLALPAALVFLWARLGPSDGVSRTRRAGNAALAALTALVICGGWYVRHLDQVLFNAGISTASTHPLAQRLAVQFWQPHGTLVLSVLALAGLLTARRILARGAWGMLAATWVVGYATLALVVDPMARYAVPLLPLSALLCATAVGSLLERLHPRWRRGALVAALVLAAACSASLELAPLPPESEQMPPTGLIPADGRNRSAFRRAATFLIEQRARALLVCASDAALHQTHLQRALLARQPMWISVEQCREMLANGESVVALLVGSQPDEGRRGPVWKLEAEPGWRLLQRHKRQELAQFGDRTPFTLSIFDLRPAQ